jgi:hypothetical protein
MDDQVVTALRAALAKAEAELQGLQREAEAIADRIEEIANVKTALEYTISRQGTSRRITQEDADGSWALLSRRAAILKLLAESARPLSPTDIAEGLVARGRTDNTRGVSATLSRLKLDAKVRSMGYSKWVASGAPESDSEAPESVEPPDKEIA